MEKQEGTGCQWLKANDVLGLLGANTAQGQEASRVLEEKQLEKQTAEAVHAIGGIMPSEEPTMTDGAAMERLEAIKADCYKLTAAQFARNYDDLIQINTLLVMEVLRLRQKCDQLVVEVFKATWNKPSGTTGDVSLVGRR